LIGQRSTSSHTRHIADHLWVASSLEIPIEISDLPTRLGLTKLVIMSTHQNGPGYPCFAADFQARCKVAFTRRCLALRCRVAVRDAGATCHSIPHVCHVPLQDARQRAAPHGTASHRTAPQHIRCD